ncbi:MAG: hypothetical protein PHS45_03895, partial [Bacilli bacterium]|nr:hypothetical protein [Bacilli bacterium]
MLKLRIILLYDYLYLILTIIVLTSSLVYTNTVIRKSKYFGNEKVIEGYIHNYNIDGNKLTINIIGKEKLIGNYYFTNICEKEEFNNIYRLGDYIKIMGEIKTPSNNTVFNLFNYKKYLYNNNIYYLFNIDTIEKISGNKKIRYNLKQRIINHINNIKHSSTYLKLFILGDNTNLNKDI